jgi:hypothetical protein
MMNARTSGLLSLRSRSKFSAAQFAKTCETFSCDEKRKQSAHEESVQRKREEGSA